MRDFLEGPACAKPCVAIEPCNVAHEDCSAEVPREHRRRYWCDDRIGTCACGARLRVEVDDGHAYLVETVDDTGGPRG
jgi:hypothetical protein